MTVKGLVIGENWIANRRPLARRRHSRRDWRRLSWLAATALTAVAVAVVLGHWLLTAPLFVVTRVESGPYRYTSAPRLEEKFGSVLGQNIWSLSASNLADTVSALPWVREVRVHRVLPATVKVEFQEWRPLLAVVPAAGDEQPRGAEWVLLGNGRVVAFPSDLMRPSLPVLVNARLESIGAGVWRLIGGEVESLLELVAAIAETGLEAANPVDFILSCDEGYTIMLQGGRERLVVGRKDFTDRLHRFLIVRDQVEAGTNVDLRFRDRLTLRKSAQRVGV